MHKEKYNSTFIFIYKQKKQQNIFIQIVFLFKST